MPGWSIDVGNFENSQAEDWEDTPAVNLKGIIVAGILDARGTVNVTGTLLMTFRPTPGTGPLFYGGTSDQFNTTLGYFGPLDGDMEGPDHKASLNPDDLARMISAIRNISISLGDGRKFPRQSEIKNIEIARKYIVAARPIKAGQVIAEGDIIAKRATKGISPIFYWDILGSTSDRDYMIDDVIVAVK